jgi:hypothetical protein
MVHQHGPSTWSINMVHQHGRGGCGGLLKDEGVQNPVESFRVINPDTRRPAFSPLAAKVWQN